MSTHRPENPKGFEMEDPLNKALHINPEGEPDSVELGYEASDVGIRGIIVFLSVLVVSVGVFFVVCFALGKLINHQIVKWDGPTKPWIAMGPGAHTPQKREDMVSSPVLQQKELSQLSTSFPTPRLQTDDGNQDTSDLHAKEDLLLEHYTYVDKGAGTIRIPIERAMALVVQRGLGGPAATANSGNGVSAGGNTLQGTGNDAGTQAQSFNTGKPLAGESPLVVTAPLTDGFARTGYEQAADEERVQRLEAREAQQEHQQAEK